MNHHFVPQFVLRRWCNEAGKLQSFRIVHGRVACRATTPEYTGFEPRLYAIFSKVFGIDEDHLEKKLFGPIDSNGAVALAKIEQGGGLSEDDHIAWAFFLSSLRLRQPDMLAHLRNDGMAMMKRFLAEGDATLPKGWPSSEQWLEAHHPGIMEAQALTSWLARIILRNEMTDRFAGLHWWVKVFKPEAPKLLLADQPLYWDGGLSTGKFYIQMPIGPDRVFFGTEAKETEAALDALPGAELIHRVNLATLASSSGRIWGIDADEGRAFIEANQEIVGKAVETIAQVSARRDASKAAQGTGVQS